MRFQRGGTPNIAGFRPDSRNVSPAAGECRTNIFSGLDARFYPVPDGPHSKTRQASANNLTMPRGSGRTGGDGNTQVDEPLRSDAARARPTGAERSATTPT